MKLLTLADAKAKVLVAAEEAGVTFGFLERPLLMNAIGTVYQRGYALAAECNADPRYDTTPALTAIASATGFSIEGTNRSRLKRVLDQLWKGHRVALVTAAS